MTRSWKPQLQTQNDNWVANGLSFPTEEEALAAARSSYEKGHVYKDFQAVESNEKAKYHFVDGGLVRIVYKMEVVKIIRAYLTLLWNDKRSKPFDGFHASLDVDYPLEKFEARMPSISSCFNYEAFYACDDPDDFDDEDGAYLDYQAFFTHLGNLPAGLEIIEKAGSLPWRIIYNSSSFETIMVESDEEDLE